MAEFTISFLLHKLYSFDSFLKENVQLIEGVREEFRNVRSELHHIQSFLRVVDSDEDTLNVWVEQVREVAYDTEDVIDEFVLCLSRRGLNMFCFINKLKARYRIACDIHGIKIRVRQVSEQYERYMVMVQGKIVEPVSHFTRTGSLKLQSQRYDPLQAKDGDLVGINEPKEQLISWLVRGSNRGDVIPVFGMGGSGKTTLVKQVYEDARVKKHFSIHVWVVVSRSLQMEELFSDMARQIYTAIRKSVPEDVKGMRTNQLMQSVKDLLLRSRYLVVLDNVWDVDVWDVIKFSLPNNNNGSRVVITTRHAKVASSSSNDPQGRILNMSLLTISHSWDLFCRRTFPGGSCPQQLESISESISKRCCGLPLAIVAISGVLATKEAQGWEHVSDNLGYGGLAKVLSLSFNDLPYHLQSCFLYLSLFPEDHPIEHRRLIRLWIAEGFVIVNEKNGKTPEEVAEGYLKKLLNRSLIQREDMSSDGRVKTYRIHNLFWEFIISKSREHCFAVVDTKWPEKTRRLSVISKLGKGEKQRLVPKLRSFLAFNVVNPITQLSTYGLRLLTVLDLQGTPLQVFPPEVVKLLLLKYLSLKGTEIKEIPRCIEKLRYLETLDLKGAFVTELPVEIQKLKNLRHLLVYRCEIEDYARFNCKFGFKSLAEIGCLESLQKLCFIEASQLILGELGKLTQLRRLGIIKLSKENAYALCPSLGNMPKLRALSITSVEKNEIIDLNPLDSPPPLLGRLYLTGRMEKLPHWISSLDNLAKLFLNGSQLKDDPLESIQHLPNLVHLEFQQVYQGEELCFRSGGFKKLKILGLDDLQELRSVEVEHGAMPCLENLILQRCRLMWKVPLGVERLSRLKVLEFFDMPAEFLMRLYPEDGEDYWRVEHIPQVYSSYLRKNGLWEAYPIESFKDIVSPGPPGTGVVWSNRQPMRKP